MSDGAAIIVVGRSETAHDFGTEIAELLYGGYMIIAIHPLGEPGIDEKERFIAFVGTINDTPQQFPAETQTQRLSSSTRTAKAFEDFETALEHAHEVYNLDEGRVDAHERFEEIKEKFPHPEASEIEQFVVFEALMQRGAITITRGLLDDEPVIVIATVTHGPDQVRVTKLAILVNDAINERLVMPFEDD